VSKPANDHQAESIRHRLRNLLRKRNEDMQFGLQRYAIERFLYRLGVSSHRDRFVLKGASLFALWGGSVYRPTRDLDFTGYGSADEADVLAALREICMLSPADELIFDPDTLNAEPIRDDSEYHGLRIRLAATLGTSRIPIQIDIGFGNAVEPSPQYADYPTLLDDPKPRIRTYPPEAVIAEKLHAMVVLGERPRRWNGATLFDSAFGGQRQELYHRLACPSIGHASQCYRPACVRLHRRHHRPTSARSTAPDNDAPVRANARRGRKH
jgi:Nucleotidyl transferase AbiEii toxin, Type IV TA system